jgi:glyoxylase-like metal-dependent hydrolase (beta-lactamase superfamily II)
MKYFTSGRRTLLFTIVTLNAGNPGPMTGRGNNTYLLIVGGTATLIDAGVGAESHLTALAGALFAHAAQLTAVVVTHAHSDHVSGASALVAAYPAARFLKMPWPARDPRLSVRWQALADGDQIPIGDDALQVIHTPGHAPDHIVLWHAPGQTVFAADLIVPGASVMIPSTRGGNLAAYMASLERVRLLHAIRLLPAHGAEVTEVDASLRAAMMHRVRREQQVLAVIEAGHETVPAITQTIYDGLSSALLPAAAENVLAHLEKLREEGAVREEAGRWWRVPAHN